MSERMERGTEEALSSVLVATDFSLGGLQAVKRAAQLPLAPGARVVLQHVLPEGLPVRRRSGVEALAAHRLEQAAELFTRAAQAAGYQEVRVLGRLDWGEPFVEIVRRGRRMGAELVVVGRHGQRGFKELLIGTTAQRVVRKSDMPVLVVNGEPKGPYRRPLLTTDLERSSQRVAEFGARLLDPGVRSAVLLHACVAPYEAFLYRPQPGRSRVLLLRARPEAAARLQKLIAILADGGLRLSPRTRNGDPRTVILQEVKRRHADLVVVGSHGRSGLARTLLGTVAEGVIKSAPCDVLVVRPGRVVLKLP